MSPQFSDNNQPPSPFPPEWACAWGQDQYGLWAAFEVAGVRQKMRWIRPGVFLMGSSENEPKRGHDEMQHEVSIISGYWLADTACTQELWQAVMHNNPSEFRHAKELPVEQISWEDCREFLQKINERHPGVELRLPSEAQWEYGCRAGTTTPFSFGEKITTDQVNYNGNFPYNDGEKGEYRKKTVPVTQLPCNDWGLYQMHGNVWEWCADWYGAYQEHAVTDPEGPGSGESRVLRGGGWFDYARLARSAFRGRNSPDYRFSDLGFRFSRGR